MSQTLTPIRRALLSVHDKCGIVELARALAESGCELISTGGTAALLRSEGLEVRDVSELTGFPEMMDGRVKTLHPRVHGGLLARRDHSADVEIALEHGIEMIDLVVVSLYPFEQVSRRRGSSLEDLVENVDIGGPTMLRSAAKNHAHVTVVCDTNDYAELHAAIAAGGTSLDLRRRLAVKVFATTAAYDGLIASTLSKRFEVAKEESDELRDPPGIVGAPWFSLTMQRSQELRYGENPHQAAAVYGGLGGIEVLHGKTLSYNNLIDVDEALEVARDFRDDAHALCAIFKHTNPCGVALGDTPALAFEQALATDSISPFGGIVIFNRELDIECAKLVHKPFMEILIAPSYSEEALHLLRRKKDRRLLSWSPAVPRAQEWQARQFFGGMLVQDCDTFLGENPADYRCVTRRQPDAEEWEDLLFAWRVVRHVKSNAILLAAQGRTLGIGAGQMSRVDASELAVSKARREGHELEGCVLASDAFFPFADGVEAAALAGVRAVIQPGGSVRDEEVIEAADRHGLAMLLTGRRHFRH